MRKGLAISAVALTLVLPSAHAQLVEVYGTFSPVHLTNVETGIGETPNGFVSETDTFTTYGYGGGFSVRVLHFGPASLSLDLRGSTKSGKPGIDTFFGGVKLGVHVPRSRLKPYAQFSAGHLESRTAYRGTDPPGPVVTNDYDAYEVIGGLDLSLIRLVDLRVFEVGFGKAFGARQDFLGNTYNPTILTFNAGIVVYF